MKTLNRLLMVMTLGLLAAPAAYARDSFNLGINIGGYGYAPPPVIYHYSGPSAIYYDAPRIYQPAPRIVYGAPIVSYQYYNGGGYNRGWQGHRGHRGHHFDRGHGRGNGRGHDHGHGRGHR